MSFSAVGWEDVRHHDEPHRRREAESAQWHHPQEGVEVRDEQATKRALRDEMTQKQVPWAIAPRYRRRGSPMRSLRLRRASARGWSIRGQNPNLRTGVIHGGRSRPQPREAIRRWSGRLASHVGPRFPRGRLPALDNPVRGV